MEYDVGHPRCRQQTQMRWLCYSVCSVEPIVQSGGLVSGWSVEAAFFFSPFAEQSFLGSVARICSLMVFPILKNVFLTSSTLKMESARSSSALLCHCHIGDVTFQMSFVSHVSHCFTDFWAQRKISWSCQILYCPTSALKYIKSLNC